MIEHIASIYRTGYYSLRNLHFLWTFFTQEVIVIVVQAFVTHDFNYCNSLLYATSAHNINRL